jgi:hypothetical protein
VKKAAALGGLLLATALHADEPRWTASVPLWKVLSTKGDLVAVHPGPSWLDSRGTAKQGHYVTRSAKFTRAVGT